MNEVQAEVLRYLGIGIEDEFGEEADADAHVDVASTSLDSPSDPVLRYESGMSRGDSLHRPGPYVPEGDIEYAFDVNTIGYLLYLALGCGEEIEDGESEGPWRYSFEADRTNLLLPSATLRCGKDLFEHVFTGCVVSSLELSMDDEFAMASASIVARKDAEDDIEEIGDLDLPDAYPLAFHELKVEMGDSSNGAELLGSEEEPFAVRDETLIVNPNEEGEETITFPDDEEYDDASAETVADFIDGEATDFGAEAHNGQILLTATESLEIGDGTANPELGFEDEQESDAPIQEDRSAIVESVDLTIDNNADGAGGVTMGSRFPRRVFAGDLEITGSMDIQFSSLREKRKFWGADSGPSDVKTIEQNITFTFDGGEHGELIINLPTVVFEEVPIQPSAADRVVQSVTFRSYYDTESETELCAELETDEELEIDFD